MKNKFIYIALMIALIGINACTGYKPIFSSSNIQFKISEYLLEGNKKLSNKIYSKVNNLSQTSNTDGKSISIKIDTDKNKQATAKNTAGKILEYKITLLTHVIVKDYLTETELLNKKYTSFSSYKVQDQYSETIKLEKKSEENLLNKIYQDLIIDLSENL